MASLADYFNTHFTSMAQLFIFVPIHVLGTIPIKAPFGQHVIFLVLISSTYWHWNYLLGTPILETLQYCDSFYAGRVCVLWFSFHVKHAHVHFLTLTSTGVSHSPTCTDLVVFLVLVRAGKHSQFCDQGCHCDWLYTGTLTQESFFLHTKVFLRRK